MPVLEVNSLNAGFHVNKAIIQIIHDLSFAMESGEVFAVIGESGSGKSVLASALTRVLPPSAIVSGSVYLNGRDIFACREEEMIRIRGSEIGYAFQAPGSALNPLITAGKQIMEALLLRGMAYGAAEQLVLGRLAALGFEDAQRVFAAYPHQLSGGMNQRVIIAAASILDPPVLILDEPTKGLDRDAVDAVLSEVNALRARSGTGVLLITHDLETAEKTARHTGVLYAGELVEYAAASAFFREPLHPYSQALMRSLPRNGFHSIPGFPGTKPEKGCSFYPRCEYAAPLCAAEAPKGDQIDGRMVKCHRFV